MELEQRRLLHPTLSKQSVYLRMLVFSLLKCMHWIWHQASSGVLEVKIMWFFSDSLSSLQAIDSCKVENPLILKILKDHSQLINSGKSITFCWIPSHVGIRLNENADTAAKAGLDVPITNMRFPVSDLLTCVNQLCVKKWQQLLEPSNKLYSVQPVIGRNRNLSLCGSVV